MSILVKSFIFLLETMFVVGLLGSLAVIAVTTVEDVEVLMNKQSEKNAFTE